MDEYLEVCDNNLRAACIFGVELTSVKYHLHGSLQPTYTDTMPEEEFAAEKCFCK